MPEKRTTIMREDQWRDRYAIRLHNQWGLTWPESTSDALDALYNPGIDPTQAADVKMSGAAPERDPRPSDIAASPADKLRIVLSERIEADEFLNICVAFKDWLETYNLTLDIRNVDPNLHTHTTPPPDAAGPDKLKGE